jgi:hypothetical protein
MPCRHLDRKGAGARGERVDTHDRPQCLRTRRRRVAKQMRLTGSAPTSRPRTRTAPPARRRRPPAIAPRPPRYFGPASIQKVTAAGNSATDPTVGRRPPFDQSDSAAEPPAAFVGVYRIDFEPGSSKEIDLLRGKLTNHPALGNNDLPAACSYLSSHPAPRGFTYAHHRPGSRAASGTEPRCFYRHPCSGGVRDNMHCTGLRDRISHLGT